MFLLAEIVQLTVVGAILSILGLTEALSTCKGKPLYYDSENIQQLFKKCHDQLGYCKNICLAQQIKVLDDDLKFVKGHARKLMETVIPSESTIDELLEEFVQCSEKIDRNDKSKDCKGNGPYVQCIIKSGLKVCAQ